MIELVLSKHRIGKQANEIIRLDLSTEEHGVHAVHIAMRVARLIGEGIGVFFILVTVNILLRGVEVNIQKAFG